MRLESDTDVLLARSQSTSLHPKLVFQTDEGSGMAKTVSELAREIMERLDRGEPLDQALTMALATDEIDEQTRLELEVAGLRDAVVHEAFHELLDWHASFGGLAEFLEIDEAIHRTADRVGHDFDEDVSMHHDDPAARLVH